MPALPDPPPGLCDATVALRLAAQRDIPEILIAHQDDPSLAGALGEARPPSGAQLGRRVEDSAAVRAEGSELWLTITEPGDGAGGEECCGQLEVVNVDAVHRRADLLVWIAPADRGRGLGSAALALGGRWLLRDAGLARVQLLAPTGNGPLRGAALRAGFVSEGVLRGYALGSSGRVDAEVLSLVAG